MECRVELEMNAMHGASEPAKQSERPKPSDRSPPAAPANAASGSGSAPVPIAAKPILPGKKPCDAPEGWCQVCERMSDIPILRSEDLLQGHREVLILHGSEVYRLLCTRNGKLILQK